MKLLEVKAKLVWKLIFIPNDFHESYEKGKSQKLKLALKENNIKFNDNLNFSINPELVGGKIKFF